MSWARRTWERPSTWEEATRLSTGLRAQLAIAHQGTGVEGIVLRGKA